MFLVGTLNSPVLGSQVPTGVCRSADRPTIVGSKSIRKSLFRAIWPIPGTKLLPRFDLFGEDTGIFPPQSEIHREVWARLKGVLGVKVNRHSRPIPKCLPDARRQTSSLWLT